jgi:hypothetical protein
MNMPEGWERFCRFTESHATTGGGAEELLEIPFLMKEMAEALEDAIEHLIEADGWENMSNQAKRESLPCYQVLKKFQEWK